MTNIKARIEQLEQKIAVSSIPSFEQFSAEWPTMDALSKALFAEFASHPEDADGSAEQKYYRAIGTYLRRMGIAIPDNAPSLREIAVELERNKK